MPMKKDLPIMDFAVVVVVVLGYDVQYYYPKCGTNYSTVHWACRMNQFGEHKLTDDARIKMSIVFLQDCLDWTSRAPSRQSIILSPSTGLARTLGKKK